MGVKIQLRRDTASNWSTINPILYQGEPGYETDTGKLKFGDGTSYWNDLSYFADGASLTLEEVEDTLGTSFLVAGSGISLNYNDSGNTLTISASGGGGITLEEVQDNLGTSFLVAGTGAALSYSDSSNTLTVNITDSPKILTTVFNKTASTIPKFSVVYINGGQGDQATIALAIASGELTSSKTYGITSEAISSMSTGKVVVFGALTGVNTDQFNPTAPTGDVNGTILYLSPTTPGGVTTTKPSAPNHMVSIGTIVRTHQNQGVVEVRVQNGFELQELHNVAINGVTDGQFLQYNSGSGLWVPTSSGNFTTLQLNGTGVSISGHTHTSSNITDFTESVQDVVGASGFLIGQSGISISYSDASNTLTITGSSSGTTIANSGDNRILTSTGTSTGINAEANMTFNGTSLVVSGNAKFTQVYPTVSDIGTTSGSVASDVSTGQIFDITVNGSTTLSNPTNSIDGVTVRWRITQGGSGSNSISLDTKFNIPSSASSPLPWSTGVGVTDILAATYDSGRDKWDVVAFVPGY